ncbi:MAG: hypothetical protein ABWX56_05260 [Mycetocola sp.]
MVERIETARTSTNESTSTSTLVTPQNLLEASRSWPKAMAQKKTWDALSPEDRLFNLCMMEPARTWGKFDESNCVVVPASVLGAVNQILVESDDSVASATAWFDEEAEFWIVVGVIDRSVGENALGAWGTPGDIALEPFEGELWALDGGAQMFSTAPLSDTHNFDVRPRVFSPLKCENVLGEGLDG